VIIFLILTGLFAWVVVYGVRRQARMQSPACPACGRPKQAGTLLCFDCARAKAGKR
jgi:hypothetical protein